MLANKTTLKTTCMALGLATACYQLQVLAESSPITKMENVPFQLEIKQAQPDAMIVLPAQVTTPKLELHIFNLLSQQIATPKLELHIFNLASQAIATPKLELHIFNLASQTVMTPKLELHVAHSPPVLLMTTVPVAPASNTQNPVHMRLNAKPNLTDPLK